MNNYKNVIQQFHLHVACNGIWFVFVEIPGKRYIRNDVLHIDNLNKKESTVVQCNATNSHGSLFSDVYINVLGMLEDGVLAQ